MERNIPTEFMQTMLGFHQFHRKCMGKGLTKRDFMALRTIMEFHEQYPDKTGIYVNDLAEQLEVSKSMVSKMLQNLEQRDLIERAVDPHNRRNTFVFLTQKGRAFDDLQRRRADAFVYQVSDRLGEERFLEIMDGIRALTGAMLEELDSVPDET